MSDHTTISDIVSAVAHNVFETEGIYDLDDDKMIKLCAPDDYTDGTIGLVVNGWTYVYGEDGFHMIGARRRIRAAKWTKGDMTVCTVNESENAGMAECELSVVANSEMAIREFCEDNGLMVRFGVEYDDTIQQTVI